MKKITFLLFIAIFSFAIGQSQQTLESVLNSGTVNLDLSQRAIAEVSNNPLTKGVSQTFTSRVDFNTACGSALTLENFAGGPGAISQCGPIISAAGEVCFVPGEIQPGIQVTMNGGADTVYIPSGSFGNANPMVGANTFANFTILNFPDNNVNSVGIDVIALTAGGTIQVRVFGTGGLIDSYNVTSPASTVFFGVIATETIVSIQLEDLTLVNAELVGMVEYGTCGGGGGGGACASPILEINQDFSDTCMANLSQGGLAQSFIPLNPESTGAGFLFTTASTGEDLILSLWDGLPNAAGTQLATGTTTTSGNVWVDVFWNPVNVTVGNTYYITIEGTVSTCVAGSLSDVYPGGMVFANAGYVPFPQFDYTFRTYSCNSGGGGCTPNNITTFFTGGNSFAGNMFDVTASGADDVLIEKFDVNVTAGSGTISVYTRPGSYVGFEGAAAGWTLMGSEVVTGAGSNLPTQVNVGGLTIPAGQTYGFYVTVSDYPSLTMNYTNGDNVFSDANITIATGVGKGNPDFTGSTFASRTWNGTIYYCSGTGGGGTCVSTTYAATGLPADIDGAGTSTADCIGAPNLYPVTVSDAGTIGTDAEIEDVTINITHTWSGDIELYLRSPSGIELMLWDNVGGSGDNFTNTQFQDGGIPSTGSVAPHTGVYAPVGGTFAAAFAGEDINGDWQLKVCDTAGGDTGTVDSFTITFCIENGGPTNNWECADAIALTCGDVVAGSTTGATNSGGNASPDVFYSYTGSGAVEFVTISLCGGGTTYDSYLRVFASCGNLSLGSEIELNDDFCGLQSQLTFESDGVSEYIIMVEGFSTSSGDFSLAITCELAPPPPACGGIFTDTGGPGGNYENNADEVWTISPDISGDAVTVIFNSFDLESGWDALYVFDGPDTSSPLISSGNPPTNTGFPAGGFYGTTNPGPFTSTHATGALTFQFLSDSSVTRAGWVADILCLPIPPPNDLIVNAIDVDQFTQPYTDPLVRLFAATNELLNPVGCSIAGTNGVWYKFTATADGSATASITTPAGASAVIFYTAPDENVSNETNLTYTFEQSNQCGPGTVATAATVAGQSYYLFVLNTVGESDVMVDISNALSTSDNTIEGFTYYPNPMHEVLHLRANSTIESVVIYTILGQKVIDQNIGATTSQLNVSNLSTGAYLMKVVSEGQTGVYRLIKK